MKIVRSKFSDWDPKTRRKLRYATLPWGYLKSYMKVFPESLTIVAFSGKQIMGWAFVLCHDKTVNLNLFVNERHRRQGIATLLIEEALECFPVITLCGWDKKSKKLFKKMKEKYPSKIIYSSWYRNRGKYTKLLESYSRPSIR